MKKTGDRNLFIERNCAMCGKYFVMVNATSWAYKIRNDYYCSYGCYRKAGGDNGIYVERY